MKLQTVVGVFHKKRNRCVDTFAETFEASQLQEVVQVLTWFMNTLDVLTLSELLLLI